MGSRTAGWLVDFAARRWPPELADEMGRAWRAEIDVILAGPGRLPRVARAVGFAGSLAFSALVEASGPRLARAGTALAAVGAIAMLAGAAVNGIHLVDHGIDRGGTGVRLAVAVILVGIAVAAAAGAGTRLGRTMTDPRRDIAGSIGARPDGRPGRGPRRDIAGLTGGLGIAIGAFLLAGNRVAVMPYMGLADIAPAVVAWTLLTGGVALAAATLVAAGRRRAAILVGAIGALIATDVAAMLGSLHAASDLRIESGSAPLWLPLSLLPGGIVRFGAYHPDGTGVFGGHTVTGPAFHASDVLLGNVSAMTGPLLLGAALVIGYAAGRPAAVPRPAPVADDRAYRDGRRAALTTLAVVAALLAPRATGIRGAELAAVVWLLAATAALGARRLPLAPRLAVGLALAPAAFALLWPDAAHALPIRAALAVGALALARVEPAHLDPIRTEPARIEPARITTGRTEPGGIAAGRIAAIAGAFPRILGPSRVLGPWAALAGGAALLGLSVEAAIRQPAAVAATVARIEHNSAAFGFGFLAAPAGQAVLLALVVAAVSRSARSTARG